MKKLLGAVIGFLVLSMPIAFAQEVSDEQLIGADAGTTPDSPFYMFKRWGEGLSLFFTFDEATKAKMHYQFAKTRLAEARMMQEQDRTELAEQTIGDYEGGLEATDSYLERAIASGRNVTEIVDEIREQNYQHALVMQRLYQELRSEMAKAAIERAMERSLRKRAEIAARVGEREFVEMTVTVGEKTVTLNVPEKFAEKFFEKAEDFKERLHEREEVKATVSTRLDTRLAECAELIEELKTKQLDNAGQALLTNAEKHLENAEAALTTGNRTGRAFGQAVAACANARNAAKHVVALEEAEERADLTVTSVSIEPLIVGEGGTASITVNLTNLGDESAENYVVKIFDFTANVTVAEQTVTETEEGGSSTVLVQYTNVAGIGDHTIVATADFTELIRESDETNNAARAMFTVNRTLSAGV